MLPRTLAPASETLVQPSHERRSTQSKTIPGHPGLRGQIPASSQVVLSLRVLHLRHAVRMPPSTLAFRLSVRSARAGHFVSTARLWSPRHRATQFEKVSRHANQETWS